MKKTIAIFICLLLLFSSIACDARPQILARSGFAMDTFYELKAYAHAKNSETERCLSACEVVLSTLEIQFNHRNTNSDFYRLNNANGAWISLTSLENSILFSKAFLLAKETDGCFDPTIGVIKELWDDFSGKVVPLREDAFVASANVDYRLMQEDEENKVRIGKEQKIDFGGIGKGFVADELVKIFAKYNCSGIINLGGNVYAVGTKPNGEPWNIGIKDPQNTDNILTSVKVSDKSVVTSGAYERNLTVDGVVYHHIFDPKTGYPAESDLLSVTIIDEDSARADAFATAIFVMSSVSGEQFISDKQIHAILVYQDGSFREFNP
jgi:thiamine biosynthesis lipoprotein